MLPEPNNRDPLKTPSAAIESAVTVLERMVAEGMITVDQAARAENELKRHASRPASFAAATRPIRGSNIGPTAISP